MNRLIRTLSRTARSAVFAATVAGLGHAAPVAAAPTGQLTWGVHISLAPAFFDPADATGTAAPQMVYYAMHDALVRPMTGSNMAPSLAEKWTMSGDGLVYEFVLRKGLKFHNGEPITTDDVKFSFERYRGASATLLKSKVAAVEIVDPLTIRFRLKEVWPDFMTFYGTTATGAGWIVPKKYVEQVGDEGFRRAPIGAGPYKFAAFKPGVELVLEAFDDYWRKQPNVKTLNLKIIPDDSTRLAALMRGEVDAAYGLNGSLAEEVKRNPKLTLKSAAIPVTQWLLFPGANDPKSPWHDVRVRQAVNLVVDRKAILDASFLGMGHTASSIIPQTMDYYWKAPAWPHDPKKAKALLTEAGFPNGFDAGDLFTEPTNAASMGEAIINDLRSIGIRARLRPVERAAFLKQFLEKKFTGIVLAGSGSPGNAATRIEQYVVTTGAYAYYGDPEIDALYKKQETQSDVAERTRTLEAIQKIIHDKAFFVPVLQNPFLVSLGARIGFDGVNAIPNNPYTSPYEDLTIR